MAQRRARAGRCSQHGGDAGQNADIQIAPVVGAVLHRLEYRRRHGKDAGIAGRYHHNALALGRHLKRMARAVDLDPVVGGMQRKAGALRHPRDIRNIAHHIRGLRQRVPHFGGDKRLRAGAKPRDQDRAAHGLRPCPCTTMIEK